MSVDLVRATRAAECIACPSPIAAGDPCALTDAGFAHLGCAMEPLVVAWCGWCGHETAHQCAPAGLVCASANHAGRTA